MKSGVAGVQELQNETAAFRSVDGDWLCKRKLQLLPLHKDRRQKLELSLTWPENSLMACLESSL
jgi:hypothetical protein